jgi:thioredoxin 2
MSKSKQIDAYQVSLELIPAPSDVTALPLQSRISAMPLTTYSPCEQCRRLNRVPLQPAPDAQKRAPICGQCKAALPLHGAVNELSASALMALVEKSPIAVVADFWAPWCQPCKVFTPVFEQAAIAMAGEVVFAKINTQAYPLASSTYGVRGIPTLIVFRHGFERERLAGALPLPQFTEWLRQSLQSKAA